MNTLTSLNKEVRPFFLSDNSIWTYRSVLPLAITAFGGPEGYFSLAITAFGASQFIVPKYYYRLALFRSLCDKRRLSRKNKFDKLSGIFPALVFVAF